MVDGSLAAHRAGTAADRPNWTSSAALRKLLPSGVIR